MGKNSRKNVLSDYKFDTKWSRLMRIAHFLDWAAKHLPYDLIPHNEICRAVNGYDRTPAMNSKEVESIRSSMSGVRHKLQDMFKRGLVTEIGVGVRASVDDVDVLKNCLTKKQIVMRSAQKGYVDTAALIMDPDKIPNTPENKPYKDWYNKTASRLLASINNESFQALLLPPPAATPSDK
jgi:hypothetical protein